MHEQGVPFVVASGNSMAHLLRIFGPDAQDTFFVADNGAHIYQNGQTLFRYQLPLDLIGEVVAYYGDRLKSLCFMLAHEAGLYMLEGSNRPFADFKAIDQEQMQAFYRKISYLEKLEPVSDKPYFKMGMWAPEAEVDAVIDECNGVFAGKIHAVTSGFGSIDLLPVGIHKAFGIRRILQELQVEAADIVAFGGNDNDLEILELAGLAYSVGHASDRVRQVADHHLATNEQSSVLKEMDRLLSSQ